MTRCILRRTMQGMRKGTYGQVLEYCDDVMAVVIFNGQRYPHKLMIKYLILLSLLFVTYCQASSLQVTANIDNYALDTIPAFAWTATIYDSNTLDMFVSSGEDDTPRISLLCIPVDLPSNITIKSIEVSFTTSADITTEHLQAIFEVEIPAIGNNRLPVFESNFR